MARSDETENDGDENGDLPMPSDRLLRGLIKDGRAAKQRSREIAGIFGEQVKDACENGHLHRKAFADARSYESMEPEALLERYTHFMHYAKVLGILDRIKKVGRLPLADEDQMPVPAAREKPKTAKQKAADEKGAKAAAKKAKKDGEPTSNFGRKLRVVQGGGEPMAEAAE